MKDILSYRTIIKSTTYILVLFIVSIVSTFVLLLSNTHTYANESCDDVFCEDEEEGQIYSDSQKGIFSFWETWDTLSAPGGKACLIGDLFDKDGKTQLNPEDFTLEGIIHCTADLFSKTRTAPGAFMKETNPAIDAKTIGGISLTRKAEQAESDSGFGVSFGPEENYIITPGLLPFQDYVTSRQMIPKQASYTAEEVAKLFYNAHQPLYLRDLLGPDWTALSRNRINETIDLPENNEDDLYKLKNVLLSTSDVAAIAGFFNKNTPTITALSSGNMIFRPWIFLDQLRQPPTYSESLYIAQDPGKDYAGLSRESWESLESTLDAGDNDYLDLQSAALTQPTGDKSTNLKVFKSGSVSLAPEIPFLSDDLAKKIRPQTEFYCKGLAPKIELEDPNGTWIDEAYFLTDGWKNRCAPLGTYAWADQVMNLGAYGTTDANYKITTGPAKPQSYTSPHSPTANMDWFEGNAHCMSRGGRLPKTDELLYMAGSKYILGDQSPFFQEAPINQAVLIPSGDFVDENGPAVASLMIPAPGQGLPWSYAQFSANNCIRMENLFGTTWKSSKYGNWKEAHICVHRLQDFTETTRPLYYQFTPVTNLQNHRTIDSEVIPQNMNSNQRIGDFDTGFVCVYD